MATFEKTNTVVSLGMVFVPTIRHRSVADEDALLETPTCTTQDVPATDQITFETPARKDSGHSQYSEENVGE
jgi:hypothetical protein